MQIIMIVVCLYKFCATCGVGKVGVVVGVFLWFPEPQLAVGAVGSDEILVRMMSYSYSILLVGLK